ncbi:general secretion pathway protein C [Buttiauxella brennerae ATCC 51605]|uniref:General secretion pathway protein C n=1 Tax=Buttiauxella brennerae ATCC 51605 TaxID=1354251 RepID=A0A1B7IQB1_9ENTR|nr:type II secretion system protein GspC [Buttiauxella brennerae]OAT31927.1 general secretion pathway protein C [Buttiauxella brennerae ATCC 51605]
MQKAVFRLSLSPPFLAHMVTIVLLCGLGYQLAGLTWRMGEFLFPDAPPRVVAMSKKPAAPAEIKFNTLFPNRNKQEIPAATLSSLKVRLTGVIVSSVAEDSLVIIEQGGQQNSYGIHDVINGTTASIVAIKEDHVELLNGGQHEMLRLYDDAIAGSSDGLSDTRAQLLKEPKKLLEMVSITPVNKDGAIQGYRLNPGKEATLFQQSGLQPNDLAIAINGFDLRIPEDAAKFMAQLSELTQLDITVLRDDAEKNIFVDLSIK